MIAFICAILIFLLVFVGVYIAVDDSSPTGATPKQKPRQKPRSSSSSRIPSSTRSKRSSYESRRYKQRNDSSFLGPFFLEQNKNSQRSSYDPHDNHWDRSFDWVDEDNDGYDDRDDGFWQEREY